MKSVLLSCLIALFCMSAAIAQDSKSQKVYIISDLMPTPDGMEKVEGAGENDKLGVAPNYNAALLIAVKKTQALGGNILKITELKTPDSWSMDYKIYGNVYKVNDLEGFVRQLNENTLKILDTVMPDTASYALLYIYRRHGYAGSAVRYNIYVDDEVVCRSKAGSKYVVKLTKPGATRIWSKRPGKPELYIDVQLKQIYFLRCNDSRSVNAKGTDYLELVGAYTGWEEFNGFKGRDEE